jgi:hypothetical protein
MTNYFQIESENENYKLLDEAVVDCPASPRRS